MTYETAPKRHFIPTLANDRVAKVDHQELAPKVDSWGGEGEGNLISLTGINQQKYLPSPKKWNWGPRATQINVARPHEIPKPTSPLVFWSPPESTKSSKIFHPQGLSGNGGIFDFPCADAWSTGQAKLPETRYRTAGRFKIAKCPPYALRVALPLIHHFSGRDVLFSATAESYGLKPRQGSGWFAAFRQDSGAVGDTTWACCLERGLAKAQPQNPGINLHSGAL